MAELYSFFNSQNRDRVYSAEHWADYFAPFFKNGVFNGQLQVIAIGGMKVSISEGYAWINGYMYHNTEPLTLHIDTASGSKNRIDNIVLRLDHTNRNLKAYVVTGEESSSAVAPGVTRTNTKYEIKLAEIKVNAGTSDIKQSMIIDTRMDSNTCGWVRGSIDEIDFSQCMAQFEKFREEYEGDMQTEFSLWFEDMKEQLSKDAAGNLQNQVNQLKQTKADLTSVFSMANMGQDVKEAMTGGSVAVVGVDAVDTINVKNNAINIKKVDFITTPKNMCDKNKATVNAYIDPKSGNVIEGVGGYTTSYYIDTSYSNYVTISLATQIVLFDKNKQYINGYDLPIGTLNHTITINGAYYMRFSVDRTSLDGIMCVLGQTMIDYVDYSEINVLDEKIELFNQSQLVNKNNLSGLNDNKIDLLIPKNVYLSNNNSLWIYFDNLIANYKNLERMNSEIDVNLSDNNFLKTNKYCIFNGNGTGKITIKDYVDETILWRKGSHEVVSVSFNVNRKNVGNGKTINTLFVGDSYFAYSASGGTGVLGYIKQFAELDGNTIVGKGTNISCGVMAEANGGWTESTFYNSEESPFVFDGIFNFSKYLSDNNISEVNNIVFHLGVNGGVGSDIQKMISEMKKSLPNCKFFICMVPSTCLVNKPSNVWYGNVYDTQRTREIQNKEYLLKFDNKQSDNIYLIPVNLCFNRETGLIRESFKSKHVITCTYTNKKLLTVGEEQ